MIKITTISNYKYNKNILIIPAIITFIVSLLLLYKYTYPISWDVYYHVHMANLYLEKGLVFWDYETVAPMGRLIMYPPLFHLILAALSNITNVLPMELAKLLQPLFAFYLIGVITYVGYKLSDEFTGFVTGLIAMLCFVTFNRSVICTPATIAIGLSMLSCLYLYHGINQNKLKYYIISSISLALVCNLHMATALISIGVLGLYGLIQLFKKNLNIKYLLIYLIIFVIIGLPWWVYIYLNYTLVFNSIAGNPLLLTNFFIKYFGITPSILTIIGIYALYKEKSDKSLFLIVWALSIVLLSQINYLGFETVSIRILEVASYPLILIAGIGFVYVYDKIIKNMKLKYFILILLILLSSLTSLIYVDDYTPDLMTENDSSTIIIPQTLHMLVDPMGSLYHISIISSRYGDYNLALNRYEVVEWFENNTNHQLLVSQDAVMDTPIVSTSKTPVVYGGFTESIPEYVVDPVHIVNNQSTSSELQDLHVGYILLYKNKTVPNYAEEVYSNDYYKICTIRADYL